MLCHSWEGKSNQAVIAANEQEDLMVRYLLGDVTEGERTQVEERFLSDHDYFEQLLAVEEKLVDQYAMDNLGVEKRESFENSSVSQRRENVAFTRELIEDIRQKKIASTLPGRPSVFRVIFTRRYAVPSFIAAATLLLLTAGASILVLSLEHRLTDTQGKLTASQREAEEEIEAERRVRLDLQRQLDESKQSRSDERNNSVLSVPLKPYRGQRGGDGGPQVIEITSEFQVVILELRLEKPGSYKSYLVKITSAENPNPMSVSGLTLEEDRSTLKVPITARLRGGDYDLTVVGQDDNRSPVTIDSYSFRVKRTG